MKGQTGLAQSSRYYLTSLLFIRPKAPPTPARLGLLSLTVRPLLQAPSSYTYITYRYEHRHTRTRALSSFRLDQGTMAASTPTPSTWFITGASSGFGQAIAMVALEAGHKVIGATRDVAKAEAANRDFAAKGGIREQLDPAHPDSASHFAKVNEKYDIDVLVNNAGYAFIGGVEDTR